MWHLVCGDNAAEGVAGILGEERARQSLRVLHDDLAVGPLHDVEQPPCADRAAFWAAVWPAQVLPVPQFESELAAEAQWLAGLARGPAAVTVWHGDSASEQLLLARLAAALECSATPLWEVACGTGDTRVAQRKAVAMRRPEELLELNRPRLAEAARRQALATQWRTAVAQDAEVRRWSGGAFHGETYADIDASLLGFCTADWQPLGWVMTRTMNCCDGFFASDFFLAWRARELAARGALRLDGPLQGAYAEQRVRLGLW
jgi:hypothetical protein